ncbi:hypothetical protein L195_g038871, partial [Trifolium pratense]
MPLQHSFDDSSGNHNAFSGFKHMDLEFSVSANFSLHLHPYIAIVSLVNDIAWVSLLLMEAKLHFLKMLIFHMDILSYVVIPTFNIKPVLAYTTVRSKQTIKLAQVLIFATWQQISSSDSMSFLYTCASCENFQDLNGENEGDNLIFLTRKSKKWDPGGDGYYFHAGGLSFGTVCCALDLEVTWKYVAIIQLYSLVYKEGMFNLELTLGVTTLSQQLYLNVNLEDKVDFKGEGIVMDLPNGTNPKI